MIKGTGEDIHPTTLQKVQEEVEGRPEAKMSQVHIIIMRLLH
jgi:hypothetical protein